MILSSYKPPVTDQVLGIGWYRYAPAWAPSGMEVFGNGKVGHLPKKKMGSDLVAW